MNRLLPWALAAACVALAATGFSRGPLAAAALGFSGALGAFFFMLLARAATLERAQVSALGGQLFYLGGALAILSALIGAATFISAKTWWVALPLAVVASPLLTIATLRLSTAAARKPAWYGLAIAMGMIGVLGVGHLVRLWKGGALPF
jgi:hypothetical protein